MSYKRAADKTKAELDADARKETVDAVRLELDDGTQLSHVVDCHVHVWGGEGPPERGSIDVLAPDVDAADVAPRRFKERALAETMAAVGVAHAVLVTHNNWQRWDNTHVMSLVANAPESYAATLILEPAPPAAQVAEMKRWQALGVRSFRIDPWNYGAAAGTPKVGGWLVDEAWAFAGEAVDPVNRLALCVLCDAAHLAELDAHIARHQTTPVVLDHLGRTGCSRGEGEGFASADVAALTAMSRFPNVHVKLSAFYAQGVEPVPPHQECVDVCKKILNYFGAEVRDVAAAAALCRCLPHDDASAHSACDVGQRRSLPAGGPARGVGGGQLHILAGRDSAAGAEPGTAAAGAVCQRVRAAVGPKMVVVFVYTYLL